MSDVMTSEVRLLTKVLLAYRTFKWLGVGMDLPIVYKSTVLKIRRNS